MTRRIPSTPKSLPRPKKKTTFTLEEGSRKREGLTQDEVFKELINIIEKRTNNLRHFCLVLLVAFVVINSIYISLFTMLFERT